MAVDQVTHCSLQLINDLIVTLYISSWVLYNFLTWLVCYKRAGSEDSVPCCGPVRESELRQHIDQQLRIGRG